MSLDRLLKIASMADPDDRDWLIFAIDHWKSGCNLDAALGLCGSAALTYRNLSLKRAADILNSNNNKSKWHVAGLLELAISRFESRVLTRYRKNPFMSLSDIDKLLLVMFEPGCGVVRKQRHIYNCIK